MTLKPDDMKHNLVELHSTEKNVSAQPLFKTIEGKITALHLQKDCVLKEHSTPIDAMLLCVTGVVIYEDENKGQYKLCSGDFIKIAPGVKHWVNATEDSQLILMK